MERRKRRGHLFVQCSVLLMGTLERAISGPFPHTWIICCLLGQPGHPASAYIHTESQAACTLTFLFLGGLSKRTKKLSSWFSYKPSHHWHAAMPTGCLLEVKSLWTSLEPRWSPTQSGRESSSPALPFLTTVGACAFQQGPSFYSKCNKRIKTIAHTLPLLFSSL